MPLEIVLSEAAEKELHKMGGSERSIFKKRIIEISRNQPMYAKFMHLDDRLWRVDELGRGKRLPYYIESGILYIPHCFVDHKDYDKWWKAKSR